MKYLKVKKQYAERVFGDTVVIANELMTEEEVRALGLPQFIFAKVNVPEERTYCFFCARFDDNDGDKPWEC